MRIEGGYGWYSAPSFAVCGFGRGFPDELLVNLPLVNLPNQPRQTRPKDLPWQRCTTHLIEIKSCEDTRPEQQLQAAHAQPEHGCLRRSIAGDHVLHVIVLSVGGVICIPHTLVLLKCLGLGSQSQDNCSQASCSFCAICS